MSDATSTDDGVFLAPSISTSTDLSSKDTYSETWEDESDGEFTDVSEWTDKQVSGLGPKQHNRRVIQRNELIL